MLKSKKELPCACGSGRKYKKCCGHPAVQPIKQLAAQRECGECQAWCEIMGVRELGKPYSTRCEHQCATGCAIYAARPHGCHVFECQWKFEHDRLLPEWRPDKSGVMLYSDNFATSEHP